MTVGNASSSTSASWMYVSTPLCSNSTFTTVGGGASRPERQANPRLGRPSPPSAVVPGCSRTDTVDGGLTPACVNASGAEPLAEEERRAGAARLSRPTARIVRGRTDGSASVEVRGSNCPARARDGDSADSPTTTVPVSAPSGLWHPSTGGPWGFSVVQSFKRSTIDWVWSGASLISCARAGRRALFIVCGGAEAFP